jgi:hypothetical protein
MALKLIFEIWGVKLWAVLRNWRWDLSAGCFTRNGDVPVSEKKERSTNKAFMLL